VIVCKQCGNHNEEGSEFCGSCGAFLEWTGERVDERRASVASPAPPPSLPEIPTTPQEPAHPPPDPPVPARDAAAPSLERPGSPQESAAIEPDVLPPESQPEPKASEPIARRPTEERARPAPRVAPPERPEPSPGDVMCPQCREPNDPSRTFCRRCGSPLAAGVPASAPARSWWQRLIGRLRRRPEQPLAAGERREPETSLRGRARGAQRAARRTEGIARSLRGKARAGLALVALLGVGVGVGVPNVRQRIVCVVKPSFDPVHPVAANAAGIQGHEAAALIDGNTSTYWAASGSTGQTITIGFQGPVGLARIGFTLGAQEKPNGEDFLTRGRPATLRIQALARDGTVLLSRDIGDLTDTAQFQARRIDAPNATTVGIQVEGSHAPAKGAPATVAIAEIEFWTSPC
jgi:hypothetical protein